jgi:hypothetical protein
MKTWVVIRTPSAIYTEVNWPDAPYPAVGDTVLFRKDEQTWGFGVTERLIGIGTDPHTGGPGCQVTLTVDAEPPFGFHP